MEDSLQNGMPAVAKALENAAWGWVRENLTLLKKVERRLEHAGTFTSPRFTCDRPMTLFENE